MNRHDFIRLAVAGFGTMLASGAAINFLSNKNTPEANVPAAEAANTKRQTAHRCHYEQSA